MQPAPLDGPLDFTFERMTAAWSKLGDKQRRRLIKVAEQIAGTAAKPHRSTLPAVDETAERLIGRGEAAKLIGVHPSTLMSWEKSGRLTGRQKIGNQVYYTREALQAACGDAYDLDSPKSRSVAVGSLRQQGVTATLGAGDDTDSNTFRNGMTPNAVLIPDAVQRVLEKLRDLGWTIRNTSIAGTGSTYITAKLNGATLDVRVSDHRTKSGPWLKQEDLKNLRLQVLVHRPKSFPRFFAWLNKFTKRAATHKEIAQ